MSEPFGDEAMVPWLLTHARVPQQTSYSRRSRLAALPVALFRSSPLDARQRLRLSRHCRLTALTARHVRMVGWVCGCRRQQLQCCLSLANSRHCQDLVIQVNTCFLSSFEPSGRSITHGASPVFSEIFPTARKPKWTVSAFPDTNLVLTQATRCDFRRR